MPASRQAVQQGLHHEHMFTWPVGARRTLQAGGALPGSRPASRPPPAAKGVGVRSSQPTNAGMGVRSSRPTNAGRWVQLCWPSSLIGLHHFWARTKLHESGGHGSLPHACCSLRPIVILGGGVTGDRDERATLTRHPIRCGPRPSRSSRGVSPPTGRCACLKVLSDHVAQLCRAWTGRRLEKGRVSIATGHHPLDGITGKRSMQRNRVTVRGGRARATVADERGGRLQPCSTARERAHTHTHTAA